MKSTIEVRRLEDGSYVGLIDDVVRVSGKDPRRVAMRLGRLLAADHAKAEEEAGRDSSSHPA